MITVTLQDMIEFVFSQPNEKRINFEQTESNSSCGCLMVQYAKHKNIQFESVGCRLWWDHIDSTVAQLEFGLFYDDFKPKPLCNYRDVKRMLKEKFPEQTKEFKV